VRDVLDAVEITEGDCWIHIDVKRERRTQQISLPPSCECGEMNRDVVAGRLFCSCGKVDMKPNEL